MRVKCISHILTEIQKEKLVENYIIKQDFHITAGKEYLVFGLTIKPEGILIIQHLTDYGHLVSAPICLFEIVNPTVSKHWEIKIHEDGAITLWPTSFYREFYHDDLFEEVVPVVEDFKKVKQMLEAEC